jgi:hypothetical protein
MRIEYETRQPRRGMWGSTRLPRALTETISGPLGGGFRVPPAVLQQMGDSDEGELCGQHPSIDEQALARSV